jgi:hypothetical protein
VRTRVSLAAGMVAGMGLAASLAVVPVAAAATAGASSSMRVAAAGVSHPDWVPPCKPPYLVPPYCQD